MASVQFTPPYSLFNPDLVNSTNPYKNPEYHKWRFNAEWYVPIGKPTGADKNRQFVLKMAAKYGFMGRYNSKLEYSPFERFQLGDAGLTNNYGLLGYDIIAHRGYPVYRNLRSFNIILTSKMHPGSLPFSINISWNCVIRLLLTLVVPFMA